ncbi:MAG: hypothetical protein JSS44_09490 [Proteobacteria bacterium]|nr:hypothetical protein [Pseudomonadota bacterium]MBS0463840.1 hypothetical protein [Pseudomonadota bacterium]
MHAPSQWLAASATALTWAFVATATVAAAAAEGPPGPNDYRHQLARALQHSQTPRDWALGAQLLETHPATGANLRERLAILRRAASAAPADRLVQALWADTSVDAPCRRHGPCGDRQALARLDPGNGVSWLPVIAGDWKAGGGRGVDAGLARLAASGRYNEHLGEAIGAWRDLFARHRPSGAPQDPDAATLYTLNLALDEARTSAIPDTTALVAACSKSAHPKAGTHRFADCGRVGRLLMDRAQTLPGRLAGVAVLRASREGTKADIPRIRTVTWQAEQMQQIETKLGDDAVGLQNYLNLIQANDSQTAAILYEMTLFGIAQTPPDDWQQTVDGHPVEPLDDSTAK